MVNHSSALEAPSTTAADKSTAVRGASGAGSGGVLAELFDELAEVGLLRESVSTGHAAVGVEVLKSHPLGAIVKKVLLGGLPFAIHHFDGAVGVAVLVDADGSHFVGFHSVARFRGLKELGAGLRVEVVADDLVESTFTADFLLEHSGDLAFGNHRSSILDLSGLASGSLGKEVYVAGGGSTCCVGSLSGEAEFLEFEVANLDLRVDGLSSADSSAGGFGAAEKLSSDILEEVGAGVLGSGAGSDESAYSGLPVSTEKLQVLDVGATLGALGFLAENDILEDRWSNRHGGASDWRGWWSEVSGVELKVAA